MLNQMRCTAIAGAMDRTHCNYTAIILQYYDGVGRAQTECRQPNIYVPGSHEAVPRPTLLVLSWKKKTVRKGRSGGRKGMLATVKFLEKSGAFTSGGQPYPPELPVLKYTRANANAFLDT